MELTIQIKQAGKKENKIITQTFLLPVIPKTIHELLTYTIKFFYTDYKEKSVTLEAYENNINPKRIYDNQDEIEAQASEGKINFFLAKNISSISEKEAIKIAIQAFEDGLIAVFIDNQRYESLFDSINLCGKEIITFVRLTMLAGRSW